MRLLAAILMMMCLAPNVSGRRGFFVVADSLTRKPLESASVFDRSGKFICTSRGGGRVSEATAVDCPLTIRFMGFHEATVPDMNVDTVFLRENIMELPEFVVESRQKKVLHVLAYVREYSTLSTYTDTVFMFREKMVDFMLPGEGKLRFRGWRYPRVLDSKSYYRFTDAGGLDSVSDRCNHYFSWSDWIGLPPEIMLPAGMAGAEAATDTLSGKYSPVEIWDRNTSRITVDVDVLADTMGRKWVPNASGFFVNEDIDFERFSLRLNYNSLPGEAVSPADLTAYSFNIESRGRGRGMFQFNSRNQPFFVATYTEAYILDKEYITVKEARKWERRKFDAGEVGIYEPQEAPELQPAILALIDRVNNADNDKIRVGLEPDRRLMSRNVSKRNFNIGYRALSMLKQLTGITLIRSHKNFNRKWNEFTDAQKERNLRRNLTDTVQ